MVISYYSYKNLAAFLTSEAILIMIYVYVEYRMTTAASGVKILVKLEMSASVDNAIFLAVTKSSVNGSVCPSVHLFHYVPIIDSSWNCQELLPLTEVMSM